MEFIRDCDLAYLQNKYHNASKPYDNFKRFILNDDFYDPATGLSGEEMCALVREEDKKHAHLPHCIRKAHAFRLVLENTRLRCDGQDYFPAIHQQDRKPVAQLYQGWKKEIFATKAASVADDMNLLDRTAASTAWVDFDHNVPIWDRVFALGFPGLLANAMRARDDLAAKAPLSEKQEAFFEAIRITYEAILTLLDRMIAVASSTENPSEKTPMLISALQSLKAGAPRTLYETLLLIYIYFMCSEHIEGLQVRSLCHMDRLLAPYYLRDRENGIPAEELKHQLAYFLMQFACIDNYWGQPMYLGGTNPDGSTAVNEFSLIILDIYDRMGILNPKIQIKYSPSMPMEFVEKALDMIRRGHSSIVFVNDDMMVKILRGKGVSEEEAHRCQVTGCYEFKVRGAAGTGMNYMNLLKPLEYVMHNGRDGMTGQLVGLETGTEFPTFASLLDAYKKQLAALIDRIVHIVNTYEAYISEMNPQNMLAATFPRCLELGRDPYDGAGTMNNTGISFGYLANIADSLAMIQKYVYDRKELTLAALTEILDKNWEGAEILRRRVLSDPDHYGNNRDLPDSLAVEISRFFTDYLNGRPNTRGGVWTSGTHVARQSYDQGRRTLASPDGRLSGTELSKNSSASMGMNREGATAAVLSVTKLDSVALSGDNTLDLGLLPSAVQGEDGMAAMRGILETFANLGGLGIHFNVFNGEILRDAQAHPEKYADLQIRVCGWNVLFNQMKKEEQDGFIRQAEALV